MKKRMTKKQVEEAQSILVNPYPYIEDTYCEDVDYLTRQIEQNGSIKPEGHINIDDMFDIAHDMIDKY